MKLFLLGAWVLGFLMTDFHGCSRAEAFGKRLLWPAMIPLGIRHWWKKDGKMYLFLDKTKR